jgi:hypothetical protein
MVSGRARPPFCLATRSDAYAFIEEYHLYTSAGGSGGGVLGEAGDVLLLVFEVGGKTKNKTKKTSSHVFHVIVVINTAGAD